MKYSLHFFNFYFLLNDILLSKCSGFVDFQEILILHLKTSHKVLRLK